MEIARYAALLAFWILMAIAVVWSIASVASPGWQVVDLREYQAIHYHGLWQDCARTFKTGYYQGTDYQNQGALHCTYKFDFNPGQLTVTNWLYVDDNSPAGENQYHLWHAYQVVPLVFIMISVICGIGAIIVSCGILRYPGCAFVVPIMAFISLLFSFGVVTSFFIIAHRVDYRFVKGVVGTYEAVLGQAYYFQLVACIFFLLAFVCCVIAASRLRDDDGSNKRRIVQVGSPTLDTSPNFVKVSPVTLVEKDQSSTSGFHGFESRF